MIARLALFTLFTQSIIATIQAFARVLITSVRVAITIAWYTAKQTWPVAFYFIVAVLA
jgi:hypothetical protein